MSWNQFDPRRDAFPEFEDGARRTHVRRRDRPGVDEEDPSPLTDNGSVEVPKHDHVAAGELRCHDFVEEVELGSIVGEADVLVLQGGLLMSVVDADTAAADRNDCALSEKASHVTRVAIAADGRGRSECAELVEDLERNEISGMENAGDPGQYAPERIGKTSQRTWNVRVCDQADAHDVVRHRPEASASRAAKAKTGDVPDADGPAV